MNTLHGYGCSFMYGLQKKPKNYVGSLGPYQNKSVGNFLAEELNASCFRNHAQSGSSNIDIAHQVKSTKFTKGDFAFILWSGLHRVPLDKCERQRPTSAEGQEKFYNRAAARSIKAVIKTHEYLVKNKVNFAMATAFQDYKFYQYVNIPDHVKTYWIDCHIKNNSMIDIITDKVGSTQWENFQAVVANDIGLNLPDSAFRQNDIRKHDTIAKCFHPTELGHKKAAKYYAERIKEKFWQKVTT